LLQSSLVLRVFVLGSSDSIILYGLWYHDLNGMPAYYFFRGILGSLPPQSRTKAGTGNPLSPKTGSDMTPNLAIDDNTVRSPLRAPHGARHRERWKA
jgi:hypothetical protein